MIGWIGKRLHSVKQTHKALGKRSVYRSFWQRLGNIYNGKEKRCRHCICTILQISAGSESSNNQFLKTQVARIPFQICFL